MPEENMKKVQITLDKGETLWYDSQVTKKAEHPPHRKQFVKR
jgi:hypothetical protein